jgi:hypothetical protein
MSADSPSTRPGTHWLIWLFAAVGLLGLLAIIALAALILGIGRGERQPAAQVAGERKTIVFTVSAPQEVPGTNYVQISVNASGGGGGSSPYSSGTDDRRNILLIDKMSGASRRILPDNARRITDSRFLPAKPQLVDGTPEDEALLAAAGDGGAKPEPAVYYLLELERADRSGPRDVLVGTIASGRQGFVMEGIDGVDTVWMQSATRVALIVRERLGLYYRVVDIPSLRVVESRPIEID